MEPQLQEIDGQEGRSSRMLVTADGIVKRPLIYLDDKEGVFLFGNTLSELDSVLHCFDVIGLNVPVNAMNIGCAVTKDDVVVASLMLHKKKQYSAIFALDVDVTPEALDYANQVGVTIHSSHENYWFPQVEAFVKHVTSQETVN